MSKYNRRQFLERSSIGSIGIIGAGNAWGLTRLEPIGDPLNAEYPYRAWEDLYEKEFDWDHVGYAAHCVNCQGNCGFQVFVKDGIVVREEQIAAYPVVRDDIPDTNPRGCQKGAIHSSNMYEGDRLRYPMKRIGERGQGKWQRISWDQAATEVADKIIDIYELYGPGHLMSHWGTGTVSHMPWTASLRFATLLGGIQGDTISDVGDLNTGAHLAYGDPLQSMTSDSWYEADYIVLAMFNPSVTRIPDAHFVWEGRYRGTRIMSVTPDYNPSSIHADVWVPIEAGTDPYFYMSLVNVVLEEDLWSADFVKEQTDLTLLVRKDNGRLLRQSDLDEHGETDVFFVWDLNTDAAVPASGSMGSEEKTIALGERDPALAGSYEVDGITVEPAFVHMRKEAARFTPEAVQPTTGVHPDLVREEARHMAAAKKLVMLDGFNIGKHLNGIYTGWAQALFLALTGHGGPTGGIDTSWLDWGWVSVLRLAFFDNTKFPRLDTGGLGEYMHGHMWEEASRHYDPKKLKERVGFDVEEMMAMAHESIDKRWMPHYGPVKGMILSADNRFRRAKGGAAYRERVLAEATDLFVCVDPRMNSTTRWADYLLPAASYYEKWDLRLTPLHRNVNFFTAPVKPIGEAKPEWEIFTLLAEKVQERAKARGVSKYEDGDFTRDFDTIYDDYTMNGKLTTARDAVQWMVENSPELAGQTFEEGAEKGFLTVQTSPFPAHTTVKPDRPVNPWEHQVVDKKPYPTLSGRITFFCDHDWFARLDSKVPTARPNAGPQASNFPLIFHTPHARWGIHSNWRSDKYMMRMQRGEPHVCISPQLAAAKGIGDGNRVRVFNGFGEFHVQAKLMPGMRDDTVMMEHGWEQYQIEGGRYLNDVVPTLLQPLELVGNWGHLKFQFLRWNQNQVANEGSVDIEAAPAQEMQA